MKGLIRGGSLVLMAFAFASGAHAQLYGGGYGGPAASPAELCAQARAAGRPLTTSCAWLDWAGAGAAPRVGPSPGSVEPDPSDFWFDVANDPTPYAEWAVQTPDGHILVLTNLSIGYGKNFRAAVLARKGTYNAVGTYDARELRKEYVDVTFPGIQDGQGVRYHIKRSALVNMTKAKK